jgi:hypothetical protein
VLAIVSRVALAALAESIYARSTILTISITLFRDAEVHERDVRALMNLLALAYLPFKLESA